MTVVPLFNLHHLRDALHAFVRNISKRSRIPYRIVLKHTHSAVVDLMSLEINRRSKLELSKKVKAPEDQS